MKYLIAVNKNGASCFISDLCEGRIDGVTLFRQCDIVNTGHSLLVDKGFTVQDLLTPPQATVFIPPFLGKRATFTKEEIFLTKQIANPRIHVERFNVRLKNSRLLDKTIPLTLVPIASQPIFIVKL